MKKIVSILLFLIFAYSLVGYYFSFKMLQRQIYQEIKQGIRNGIPENELVVIKISMTDQNTLVCTRKEKEFKYHGKTESLFKKLSQSVFIKKRTDGDFLSASTDFIFYNNASPYASVITDKFSPPPRLL